MTLDALAQCIGLYRPGLEAQVSLLHQLRALAHAQQDAMRQTDVPRLGDLAGERDRLMAALVKIEHEIRPTRDLLARFRQAAATLEGFETVVTLHRVAQGLVGDILRLDQDTIHALKDAEAARREAAQTMETAGSTLAAYRRVVAPSLAGSGLVNRRG